jgi:hypothetical protein
MFVDQVVQAGEFNSNAQVDFIHVAVVSIP